MADWMDSVSRGFRGGNEIGETLAARGLRKRTADAERQLLEGELTPEQYEQAIRDAQGRGFARFRDTEAVAEGLRTRPLDVLNRRDDRQIADAAADGRMVDAWQIMRNRTTRMGDVPGSVKVREGLDAIDEAGQVTNYNGVTNFAPAMARKRENLLRVGDVAGAQAADTAQRTQMDAFAQNVFNGAIRQYQSGNIGGAIGVVNGFIEQIDLPFEFQIDRANSEDGATAIAMVPKGEGGQPLILSEDQFFQQLGGIADGSNTLKNLLTTLTQQDEARTAREQDLTTRIEDGVIKILTESGANPTAAGRLSSALESTRSAGIETISARDDGSLLLEVNGQLVTARPPAEPNADGTVTGVNQNWTFLDAGNGQPVDVSSTVSGAVQEFALAERLAFDQGQYRISAEDRNARIAQLMQFAHSQLGRPGVAPAAAGMLLDAAGATMDDEAAVEQFAATVDKLEGTGAAGTSSAIGRGQFTDSTMLSIARKYFPEATAELDDAQILQLRTTNPEFMGNMIRAYAKDNIEVLRRNDVPVNPVTLYMGHHFGGQRAAEIFRDLQENPSMSTTEAFTPRELRANEYLKDAGTLAGVLQNWRTRQPELFDGMTGRQATQLLGQNAPAAARAPAGNTPAPAAPTTPPIGPQVAALPAAQQLAELRQRQRQLQEVVQAAAEATTPRWTPAPPVGGMFNAPAYDPSERLSAADRQAAARAAQELDRVKAEIATAELDLRKQESAARLRAALSALGPTASTPAAPAAGLPTMPSRFTTGAP